MRRMRAGSPGDPAVRVRRALLLLPLVAGVLAMHVLLLCAGPDPMAGHAGHGAATTASAPAGHAAEGHSADHAVSGTDSALTAAAGVARAVTEVAAGSPDGAGDHGAHAALTVCLAVLVALVALLLAAPGRRGAVLAVRTDPARWTAAAPWHPPPPADLALLHCVSRT